MYSPKYVDYLDKKRIESAFYNPKSKPKTWVGVIPKTPETRMNTGFFARQNGSWYWIDTNFSNPALRENDSKTTSKTFLLKGTQQEGFIAALPPTSMLGSKRLYLSYVRGR